MNEHTIHNTEGVSGAEIDAQNRFEREMDRIFSGFEPKTDEEEMAELATEFDTIFTD